MSADTLTMETGDYGWLRPDGTTVLVERKEVSDLFHSLHDGRWSQQIPRLIGEADVPVVLIEGSLDEGNPVYLRRYARGITPARIDTALALAQLAGAAIVHCRRGPTAVVGRLFTLYDSLALESHGTLVSKGARVMGTSQEESVNLGMLTALPGCGDITARRLVNEHGSVRAVIEALVAGYDTRTAKRLGVPAKYLPVWRRIFEWQKA